MSTFPVRRVLVVGDVMLDRYLIGHCDRVSPEAPVPVVRLESTKYSLGGAANAAANLAALSVSVELVGRVGTDESAGKLCEACHKLGIGTSGLLGLPDATTTVKTRVLAGDRQLMRVDEENVVPVTEADARRFRLAIQVICASGLPDAVLISDYAKGVCSPELCRQTILHFRDLGIPVFVDPKGRDYAKYRGATGITPNRSEMLEIGAAMGWATDDLVATAETLRAHLELEFVALTLGAEGIALIDRAGVTRYPAKAKEVFDVSGAGDTVIATMVASIAAGLDPHQAIYLANIAAAEVVGHVGSRPIYRDELLLALQSNSRGVSGRKLYETEDVRTLVDLWKRRGLRVGFTNGCYDLLHAGHVRLLEDAAAQVDRLVLGINSDASVTRLKGPLRPLMKEEHRVAVLSALESVDAVVVFSEDTPLNLIEAIVPDVLIKGGDYTRDSVVGADFVEAHGGRVALIPLVPGVSTSYLADSIKML